MNTEVERLFHELIDLPGEARLRYFAEHPIDVQTRQEVEALLRFDSGASTFLLRDISIAASQALSQFDSKGERCGPYRLLDVIGRGGMGAVYMAERADGEVTQRLAVKLLPPGAGDPQRERFLQERQILAALTHPNIARMLDAGRLENGQPFLAMEYVEGQPIDVFAAALSIRRKIALFLKVCAAVSYLHRNLIVHRDLKPSNILVTAEGEPKLLDFGIAKMLDIGTDTTMTGMRMLTPDYASPEQVAGGRVSTATDLYSLGAVLYRLVTGQSPHQFEEQSAGAISSVILTRDPVAPGSLVPEVKGDLEAILLKALRKDPQERYETVEQFTQDLEAFLESRPVRARSGNQLYRLRKWVRRYWIPVGATGLVVAGLASAFYVAHKEGAVAAREAAAAQAVNDFLQNDLLAQASAASQSGPNTKPDPDLKVRSALDRAAARIAGKFERQPEVEASIRETIGQSYVDLGLYREARTHLERALELRRRLFGAGDPKTVRTLSRLGNIAYLQGRYQDSESLFRESLDFQRRLPGLQHPDTLYSMNGLAVAYARQGKYDEAEALFSQTMEIGRRVLGPEHPTTLNSMHSLVIMYQLQDKLAQAEALGRETLELKRRVLGPEHPSTINSIVELGLIYFNESKYAQAGTLDAQALDIQRSVLGPQHPSTLISMNNLAGVYNAQGKSAEGEALAEQTVELMRRALGPEHAYTLQAMTTLAEAYALQAKYPQAEAVATRAIEIRRRRLGPDHPETLNAQSELAFIYQIEGKYVLAAAEAAEALAGRRRILGSNRVDTMTSAAKLAMAYISLRKFADAEPLAREAWEFHRKQHLNGWEQFRAESLVGSSLAGLKKYDVAEPLLLEGYKGMLARKDAMEASDRYYLSRASEWLEEFYQATGQPEKAAEWRKEAGQWRGAVPSRRNSRR